MDYISMLKNIDPIDLLKSPQGVFAVALIFIGFKALKNLFNSVSKNNLFKDHLKKAEKYIQERNQILNKFYEQNKNKFSEKVQNEIINSSCLQLKKLLEEGKITSEQIVTILLCRIAKVGVENRGIADINIEETLYHSRQADKIYEKIKNGEISLEDSRKNQPLLGIPFTMKENIAIKGFRTTFGYLISYNRVAQKDSALVEVLKRKGAVPLAAGNVPQGLFMMETTNNIFGRALNPFDHKRTPGGSTGGDSAIVASLCSPLAFGNDFGGSLRLPAVFCGLYTVKGTSVRISGKGILDRSNTYIGFTAFINRGIAGPLTRTFDDLLLVASNYYGEFNLDNLCSKAKFDFPLYHSIVEKKKFKIGYFMGDEFIQKPTFPIENLMNDVINTLKNYDKIEFEIVKFDFKSMNEFHIKLLNSLLCCKSISVMKNAMVFEPLLPEYKSFETLDKMPGIVRSFAKFMFKILGRKREYLLAKDVNPDLTLSEYFAFIRKIEELKVEFNEYYQELGIDAILSPASAHPAIFHGMHTDIGFMAFYTFIFNFLDYPSGILPVRKVGRHVEKYVDDYNDKFTKSLNRILENCENLPIGVQISTITGSDERCYAVMKVIDQILKEKNVQEKIFD